MTKIGRSTLVADAMRENALAARSARIAARPSARQDPPSAQSAADTPLSVDELVAMRVGALSSDDRQPRKAVRIYLQAVLAKALGQQRPDDASFERLVDRVLGQMESDASLAQALREAGELLLAQAAAPGPESRT